MKGSEEKRRRDFLFSLSQVGRLRSALCCQETESIEANEVFPRPSRSSRHKKLALLSFSSSPRSCLIFFFSLALFLYLDKRIQIYYIFTWCNLHCISIAYTHTQLRTLFLNARIKRGIGHTPFVFVLVACFKSVGACFKENYLLITCYQKCKPYLPSSFIYLQEVTMFPCSCAFLGTRDFKLFRQKAGGCSSLVKNKQDLKQRTYHDGLTSRGGQVSSAGCR